MAGRHGGEGGYEQPYKQSLMMYLTATKVVYLIFMGFEKTLPGFDQHFTAKCLGFPLFSVQNTASLLKLL
jgi:hypothetical protein